MPTVIKRNGKTEAFNEDKVAATLASVSDEAGCPLCEADIHSIITELRGFVNRRDTISSREVYVLVVGLMMARRMFELAERYVKRSSYL